MKDEYVSIFEDVCNHVLKYDCLDKESLDRCKNVYIDAFDFLENKRKKFKLEHDFRKDIISELSKRQEDSSYGGGKSLRRSWSASEIEKALGEEEEEEEEDETRPKKKGFSDLFEFLHICFKVFNIHSSI